MKEESEMRLTIEFRAAEGEKIPLPLHYNKAIQGMIYHHIKDYIPELHEKGYEGSGRVFRLFVFSRMEGSGIEIRNGTITFHSPVRLKIGSQDDMFLEILANSLLRSPQVNVYSHQLFVSSIAITKNPDFSTGHVKIKAISPITVYSTLLTPNGKKKTYYYHPSEKEFSEQIRNNIMKKAEALGMENKETIFNITPYRVKNTDLKTVFYNDFVIKGWLGQYILSGTPELLNLAYNTGLGAKNSQGFGMFETI